MPGLRVFQMRLAEKAEPRWVCRRLPSLRRRSDGKSKTRPNYSPEVRERAVRMVREQTREHASQWAAIEAIAPLHADTYVFSVRRAGTH